MLEDRTVSGEREATGRPCLIPVHVDTSQELIEGFITRLSDAGATLTLEGSLAGAQELFVHFRRPNDGLHVAMRSKVVDERPDDGLWRGHPAVRVRFAISLDRALTAESSLDLRIDELDASLEASMGDLGSPARARPGERILSQVPVQFLLGGRLYGGYASNFGQGGLFITSLQRPEIGAQVHVHFPVPIQGGGTQGLEFDSVVRWRPDPEPDGSVGMGFGVAIERFDDEPAERLYRAFVSQLLEPGATPGG